MNDTGIYFSFVFQNFISSLLKVKKDFLLNGVYLKNNLLLNDHNNDLKEIIIKKEKEINWIN